MCGFDNRIIAHAVRTGRYKRYSGVVSLIPRPLYLTNGLGNIFTLQTHFRHQQCGQRWREETLERNSWSVNVYCTRTGSHEDKPGYLQRHQRSFDGPSLVADDVFIMRSDFLAPLLFV